MDELLTEVQVGALLGVAATTLQQWRHRGKGPPFIKEGMWVRYRRGDVDVWLSSRRGLTESRTEHDNKVREARSQRLKDRWAKLTPEQRSEKGRKAVQARWARARGAEA